MPREFYDKAFEGASTSNLHQGQDNLADAVAGFVFDSDERNIDRVGHRRWILSPGLREVGFGYAKGFVALKVLSKNGTDNRSELAYVAWLPSAKFRSRSSRRMRRGRSRWTRPRLADNWRSARDGVRVELTRARDGKVWRLGTDRRGGTPLWRSRHSAFHTASYSDQTTSGHCWTTTCSRYGSWPRRAAAGNFGALQGRLLQPRSEDHGDGREQKTTRPDNRFRMGNEGMGKKEVLPRITGKAARIFRKKYSSSRNP